MTVHATVTRFILVLVLYVLTLAAACTLIWQQVSDQEVSTPGPRRTRPGDRP